MKKPIAIVFDLGNVLLPIDLDKTYEAFALYSSVYNAEEIKLITQSEELWVKYESGLQSDLEFEVYLKDRLRLNCTSQEFQLAFKALLLKFDEASCQYIKLLRSSFPIYLLSNTSRIHSNDFLKSTYPNFEIFDAFSQVHLSYEMGLVKPNQEIYQRLVDLNQLQDYHIVFFDDNSTNVEAALKFGWEAILINPNTSLHQIKHHIQTLC